MRGFTGPVIPDVSEATGKHLKNPACTSFFWAGLFPGQLPCYGLAYRPARLEICLHQ